jgi:competence protein ComEC
MSDRWAVLLAVCAAVGAARPSPAPLLLGVLLVAAAFVAQRPAWLCLAALLLVSSLATRALQGLDGVVPGRVRAEVTLVSDPAPSFRGVRADARLEGRRVELRADGSSADALRGRLAGERIAVSGELQPVPPGNPWLTTRHVSGVVWVHAVTSWRLGSLPSRVANALRRVLVDGAQPLSAEQRSLYTGLVIGDDRDQPVELADDFLGAGLTHLLAVSGQNVAFALALAGPVLRRLRIWPRLLATLVVIAMFGLMTRFEPSVLRAATMAGLATVISTGGSPASRLRILALAVTGLLVVDPLLVRSVGFQLSTSAAGAIVLLAPRLTAALPGPAPLREAAAITVAAQVGVAPVLITTFGPLPVASFGANLLAVPAAGPVMVWGLTAGLAAGLAGGWVAELVHLPTRLLLLWLAEVAARASALPLGSLQGGHVVVFAAGLAAAVWGRTHLQAAVRRLGLLVAASVLGVVIVSARAPVPLRSDLAPGIVRWHAGSTDIVVLGGAGGRSAVGASTALAELREAHVGSVDLLVVADAAVTGGVITAVEARHPIGMIVALGGAELVGAHAPVVLAPRPGGVLRLGSVDVRITALADRLVVEALPVAG